VSIPRRYAQARRCPATSGDPGDLGAPVARHDQQVDQLGREEAVLDDTRLPLEPTRQFTWIAERTVKVGDQAIVRRRWRVCAQLNVPNGGDGRVDAKREQLERHRRLQPLD
jgi:hypothetical protein